MNDKPSVQFIEIDEDLAGQRIDNFLFRLFKRVPKSRIYRGLRSGEVRVNKKRVQAKQKLVLGDIVRLPPFQEDEAAQPRVSASLTALLEDAILYEDDTLLILNKPAGWAVHGGSGIRHGIVESVRQLRPHAKCIELIHRLDRDTSGCLMLAKNRQTLREIHGLLREHKIEKRYTALVQGHWPKRIQKIDQPLQKNVLQSGERLVKVSQDGKPAVTLVRPLQYFQQATLLDIHLLTGRTHQIRVHTQWTGHAIAGDEKYGKKTFNCAMKERGLARLFLHARQISFQRRDGENISVEAALDGELLNVLKKLG